MYFIEYQETGCRYFSQLSDSRINSERINSEKNVNYISITRFFVIFKEIHNRVCSQTKKKANFHRQIVGRRKNSEKIIK